MKAETQLRQLFRRWRYTALLEHVLLGMAVAFPLTAMLYLFTASTTGILLISWLAITVIAALVFLWRSDWFNASPVDLAQYLNRNYPGLENSADLLLRPSADLPPLARLQQKRAAMRLKGLDLQLPNRIPRILIISVGAFLLSFTAARLAPFSISKKGKPAILNHSAPAETDNVAATPPPPELRDFSVYIRPPAYTRQSGYTQATLDIEAPVESQIQWTLEFAPSITEGKLTTGDGREIPLQKEEDSSFSAQLKAEQTTFYSISFRNDESEWTASDYYRLQVIPDQPPKIEIEGLPQYAEYPYDPGKTIRFAAHLNDDYGITDVRLIATVSSGEGESVKFRDDTLQFANSFDRQLAHYTLEKTIRLGDLEMAPGDELYLHVEAVDNRRPKAQVTKTSKYIIAFENPDAVTLDMSGGLAVSRLPEYFRSQRQIIIDTEALIAKEKELEEQSFKEKSNNIAIDQKLLRLRYGRFLGEEFQTVIGEVPDSAFEETEGEEDHEQDDHENEQDHEHETPDPHAGHDHGEEVPQLESEDGEVAELEPYYHTHDMTEEATFFDAATSAKLRAALAEMWDAELHLRMGAPRKALPYEYKALKLIKEIQQASRIYVERIGFEPPVINVAEKRLTGELDDIVSPKLERQPEAHLPYPAVAAAAPVLETLRREDRRPDAREYNRLQAAGEEIAALAIEQPGAYLNALRALRFIMEEEGLPRERERYLRNLQQTFWSLLPDLEQQPLKATTQKEKLEDLYLKEIQQTQ